MKTTTEPATDDALNDTARVLLDLLDMSVRPEVANTELERLGPLDLPVTVVVCRHHLRAALGRHHDGTVSTAELRQWARAVKARRRAGVVYEPAHASTIERILEFFADPSSQPWLSIHRPGKLLDALEEHIPVPSGSWKTAATVIVLMILSILTSLYALPEDAPPWARALLGTLTMWLGYLAVLSACLRPRKAVRLALCFAALALPLIAAPFVLLL